MAILLERAIVQVSLEARGTQILARQFNSGDIDVDRTVNYVHIAARYTRAEPAGGACIYVHANVRDRTGHDAS